MLKPEKSNFREMAKTAGLKNLVSMLMSPKEKMERRLQEHSAIQDDELSSPTANQKRAPRMIDELRRKKRLREMQGSS